MKLHFWICLLLMGMAVEYRTKAADAPPGQVVPPQTNTIRLAIGSLGLSDERNNQLNDLLVAKLTSAQGLELVERQALKTVLQEAELSLSGVVRAKDAIRVGRLLRADWFLLGASAGAKGTNAILVRLVDARSGIIRDIGIFQGNSPLPLLAEELANFVIRSNTKSTESHLYLAIGGFQDVSINNRLAAFPNQLRAYLAKAYQQDSKATLLERELVTALLNEVRMDLNGLTEGSGTNTVSPMQAAFWIVDGYYQSYETAGAEVDLVLRVERILGGRRLISLRGKPDEQFLGRVVEAINAEFATNAPLPYPPNAKDEIEAQMSRGKQRLALKENDLYTLSFRDACIDNIIGGNFRDDPIKKRRNVEEAMQSFETVLLLDPDHREAKVYLAACLYYSPLGRTEEARNYYREIIGSGINDKWSDRAKSALAHSYLRIDDRKALELFKMFANQSTDSNGRYWIDTGREIATLFLVQNNGITLNEYLPLIDEKIFKEIQEALDRYKTWKHSFNFDFVIISHAFNFNGELTAKHINGLLPKLKAHFPELEPYLLLKAVSYQIDTNGPVVHEFRKSLDACASNPDKLIHPKSYFENLMFNPYSWALGSKFYDLAIQIAAARRMAASKGIIDDLDDSQKVGLGYAYMGLERWKEALEIFDSFGTTAPVADICRQHLGISPSLNTNRFELGKPFIALEDWFTFLPENNTVWIAAGDRLFCLDASAKRLQEVHLDKRRDIRITCLCSTADKVWIGTQGEGLFEYDKLKKTCRKFTENDGLLLNEVTSLYLRDHTLWIGFGHQDQRTTVGGVGQLDLQTQTFSSFTPPLRGDLREADSSRSQIDLDRGSAPPRTYVRNITDGGTNAIYCTADGIGLKRYWLPFKQWHTMETDLGRDTRDFATCLASDSQRLFVGYREYGGTLQSRCFSGGIGIYACQKDEWASRTCTWEKFNLSDGLPGNSVMALAVDGQDLWVAGKNYIAVVNLSERKVRKIAHIKAERVDKLLVSDGYLWVQLWRELYRIPLASLR